MNFPKFWANGSHNGFDCWRWSNTSLAEAEAAAGEAARKLADRFARKDIPQGRYAYGDRPLREPVMREFKDATGNVSAAVTRNSYGCLVLNTARVMFVDVDLPELKLSGGGFLKKLFGKSEPAPAQSPIEAALAKVEAWRQRNAGWGWRVYRTRAGLRILATHDVFVPDGAVAQNVFDALGADPLYRQLCKLQKCYRARLTPKPWRCGVENPRVRWPWRDARVEAHFKEWEKKYLAACGDFATCELIAATGPPQNHADIQLVIKIHDEATRAESKLELA